MSQFRVYIAMSLDGYIAAPDGSVAWLEAFPVDEFDMGGFFTDIAVTVIGRPRTACSCCLSVMHESGSISGRSQVEALNSLRHRSSSFSQ